MRSVRLDPEMDGRLRRAAAVEGLSVSEFIRRAAADRANHTLSDRAEQPLRDVLGAINSDKRHARRSGAAFADLVAEKHKTGQ